MQTTTTDQHKGNRALSIADAARLLALSKRTVERRISTGKIKAVRVSERRLVVTTNEIAQIRRWRLIGVRSGPVSSRPAWQAVLPRRAKFRLCTLSSRLSIS